MARSHKPSAYTVTVEDVSQVILEHAQEWGATAYLVVTLGKPTGPSAYFEVTLREGFFSPAGKELQRIRYPLDAKDAAKWPGQLLWGVVAVYDALKAEPWSWPASKRKEAAGEM